MAEDDYLLMYDLVEQQEEINRKLIEVQNRINSHNDNLCKQGKHDWVIDRGCVFIPENGPRQICKRCTKLK